jgi:two-component system cell cycle sensor histidine kinase/response regulator CckA
VTRDERRSGPSLASVIEDPERLISLRSTGLLDSPADPDFDRWTAFVRRTLDADVSLINLIDRDRQFFKSTAGLGEPWATIRETALSRSFCKFVVTGDETLRVTDARRDPQLAGNPAVEELGMVAYLGVPLRTARGRVLGAISAIQQEPREWSERDLQTLEDAATAVQAQIRLRTLGGQMRAALTNVSDMISIIDEDGWTLYRSPSIRRILGHDLTSEAGVRMDLVHPDDRAKVERAGLEARAGPTGHSVEITVRIRDAEGRYRTLESRVTNLVDDPAVGGFLWVAHDVTDRTSAQERLSLLLSHAPVALWTVDPDLRFTWTGGSALDDLGLSEEALGATVDEIFGSDEPTGPPTAAYRRALDGEPGRFDAEWGGRTWAVRISPLVEAGTVVAVVGVAVDVTHHREIERRLEERTAHFQQLFEEAPEAIVVLDDDDRVLEANPEFERLFGYDAEEAAGRLLNDLIAAPGQEEEATEITQRVIEGERVELEAIRHRKDGSPVEVSILATPVDVGDERQIYGIYRNITDRKSLEAQLLHSQRLEAVGQLAGGIAHDFNNILTAILGQAQVLLAQHRNEPGLREDLQEIQDAGQRAARLTRQLLTFSRKDIASPRPLDVNRVVRGTRAMLERLIEERIRLSFELQDDLLLIEVDPGQLEQVVMNLVINARDAMPEGGRLTVSTSRCTPEVARRHEWIPDGFVGVVIEVADQGTGMTPEEHARIFEPFFTTKTPGEGTGLGLSTVYGIVERAGGFIHVDTAPNAGTRIQVYLPALAEPPAERVTAVEGASDEAPVSRSELILLVDDDRPVRNVTRRILEHAGYRVVEAESGEDALALCSAHDIAPAAVVSDLVMPGISGYELVRELEARYPDIAVLLMTGYTEPGTGDSAREGELLRKPFEATTLVRRLRELLARESD